MRDIRARIAQRHGIDLTNQQVEELAARRLEAILDPRSVKPALLEQLRKSAGAPASTEPARPAEPAYTFEEDTLYESHRGLLTRIRALLNPILKLFFNPNPLVKALNTQARLNIEAAAREAEREQRQTEWNALQYELIQRVVTETARVSIEMQQLTLRVESLATKVDFNERRVRSIEGGASPSPSAAPAPARPIPAPRPVERQADIPLPSQPAPAAPIAAMVPAAAVPAAAEGADAGQTGDAPRRRRRRRRGRRNGPATGEAAANSDSALAADAGDGDDGGDDDGPGDPGGDAGGSEIGAAADGTSDCQESPAAADSVLPDLPAAVEGAFYDSSAQPFYSPPAVTTLEAAGDVENAREFPPSFDERPIPQAEPAPPLNPEPPASDRFEAPESEPLQSGPSTDEPPKTGHGGQ